MTLLWHVFICLQIVRQARKPLRKNKTKHGRVLHADTHIFNWRAPAECCDWPTLSSKIVGASHKTGLTGYRTWEKDWKPTEFAKEQRLYAAERELLRYKSSDMAAGSLAFWHCGWWGRGRVSIFSGSVLFFHKSEHTHWVGCRLSIPTVGHLPVSGSVAKVSGTVGEVLNIDWIILLLPR